MPPPSVSRSTAELEPIHGLDRPGARAAGHPVRRQHRGHDFNMFVLGPPASARARRSRRYLDRKARPARCRPIGSTSTISTIPTGRRRSSLPTGRARTLAQGMIGAIDELRATLPAIFEGEDYQARRRSIDEEFRSGQEEAFEALNRKAQAQNIAILRTPTGFAMAPMHEGKIVKPEVFNTLPEAMRAGSRRRSRPCRRSWSRSSSECRSPTRSGGRTVGAERGGRDRRDPRGARRRRRRVRRPARRSCATSTRPAGSRAQRRPLPRRRGRRAAARQAARRHRPRCPVPPLHGQCHGRQRASDDCEARRWSRSSIPPTAT